MSSSASVASEVVRPILYTILSQGSDWILCGKMQGLIDLSSPSPSATSGGGSQEGDEDGDDRDHDHQFDQGETLLGT